MLKPAPQHEPLRSRSLAIILQRTTDLLEHTTTAMRKKLREALLDFDRTQYEIAEDLAADPFFADESQSVRRTYVGRILPEVLTQAEHQERNAHMQRRVSAASLVADYDRAACGKISGDRNAELWRQRGFNNCGRAMWTDEEVAAIQDILNNDALYHDSGKQKGKPKISEMAREFLASFEETSRSFAAVRKQVRLQYSQLLEGALST